MEEVEAVAQAGALVAVDAWRRDALGPALLHDHSEEDRPETMSPTTALARHDNNNTTTNTTAQRNDSVAEDTERHGARGTLRMVQGDEGSALYTSHPLPRGLLQASVPGPPPPPAGYPHHCPPLPTTLQAAAAAAAQDTPLRPRGAANGREHAPNHRPGAAGRDGAGRRRAGRRGVGGQSLAVIQFPETPVRKLNSRRLQNKCTAHAHEGWTTRYIPRTSNSKEYIPYSSKFQNIYGLFGKYCLISGRNIFGIEWYIFQVFLMCIRMYSTQDYIPR